MFTTNTYKGIIEKYLNSLNLTDLTTDAHWMKVSNWLEWYQGKVDNFHNYTYYNGTDTIPQTRYSAQMAKRCCEDWADLLLNEKVKIMIDDENLTKVLDKVLLDNDFYVQGNMLIEKSFALGEGAFIEYFTGNPIKPIGINYCNARMIYPLRYDGGQLVDCAFCWLLTNEVYYVNIHIQEADGTYTIYNKIFKESEKSKDPIELELPNKLERTLKSPIRLFQIIKPNNANNIDIDNQRGISVFANSLDQLKDIDLKFDSYNKEFKLGRKRMLFNSDVAKCNVDIKGNITPVFDSNDLAFYAIAMGENGKPIEYIDGNLRVAEHDQALQTALNLFSDSVGFGTGHYSLSDGHIYVNETSVISSNSKMFRRLKKHEIVLEKALIDLSKAIIYMATGTVTDKDISINFDDSIIEDKAEQKRQALLEFNAGLIDKVQYFMETRNMDESTAQTFVDKIEARIPEPEMEPEPEGNDESER